jgi:hypothetical protein
MSPDITDLDWVAEQLPDVMEPDDAVTDHARTALMDHLAAPAATPARRGNRRRAWRRTRRPLSLGLAAAAAAAGVFVVVNVNSGGGGSVTEAQAAKIVAHARRSLAATPGLVLEYTVTRSNGPTIRTAQDGAAPHDWVQIWTLGGTHALVRGQEGHRQEFYDPANNTIYRDTNTIPGQGPVPDDEDELPLLKRVGRNPTVDRHAMLDGKPAMLVTLQFPGGTVYRLWVDPHHGDRPLRLTSSGGAGPQTATTTWSGYHTVTAARGAPSPARISARFESATIKTLGPKQFGQREYRYLTSRHLVVGLNL